MCNVQSITKVIFYIYVIFLNIYICKKKEVSRQKLWQVHFHELNSMNWIMINTVVPCGKPTNQTADETNGPHS